MVIKTAKGLVDKINESMISSIKSHPNLTAGIIIGLVTSFPLYGYVEWRAQKNSWTEVAKEALDYLGKEVYYSTLIQSGEYSRVEKE